MDGPSDDCDQILDGVRLRARINPTVAALMRRGFDSRLAERVRARGLTLGDLKQQSDADLALLGLSADDVASVREGARPPIPFETLVQVLWANRSTCCVCRTSGRAIILHHIDPWARSRDHSAANLAVLCLEHHAQAHRKGTLEQNLGSEQLHAFKARWEEEVRHLDPQAILAASRLDGHHWWWFNHVRVLEMAQRLRIDLTRLTGFVGCASRGWVDERGQIAERHRDAPYMYAGGDGIVLYGYMREVVEAVCAETVIFNLSDDLDPGFLRRVVRPGDIVLVQGRHTFKSLNRVQRGPGQACAVRRQANGVRVTFTIDRWEAVANSSWAVGLSGAKQAASIVRIGEVARDGEHLRLACTGITVGSALRGLSKRYYASGTWPGGEDDEDDDWNFDDDAFGASVPA
jgi:hypothetical protein